MTFDPNLNQGDTLSNKELCSIFKCSPQGGMRPSLRTKTLTIVSNHTRSIYDDRWLDNIFHYTGMGLSGDQRIDSRQNRTLNESDQTKIGVHLFEVFQPGEYIYQGRVKLADKPYQEKQPDSDGKTRNVWMFPLKLTDYDQPIQMDISIIQERQEVNERQLSSRPLEELSILANSSSRSSGNRTVVSRHYDRNKYVAAYAKKRARGKCQLCQNPAPFKNRRSIPYLEVHHIEWLSRNGSDTIENTVALCPNCHRKMHILDLDEDKNALFKITK